MKELYNIKHNGEWVACFDLTGDEVPYYMAFKKLHTINLNDELEVTNLQTGDTFNINLFEAISDNIIFQMYHSKEAYEKNRGK